MKSHASKIFARLWSLCIVVCLLLPVHIHAQNSPGPGSTDQSRGEAAPVQPGPGQVPGAESSQPAGPGPIPGGPTGSSAASPAGEIFFAAAAVSPSGKYLYAILDRFLLRYNLPELELDKKAELPLISAPVSPSISVSPDEKYIYVVQNGMIFKIDAKTWQIQKAEKIEVKTD